MVVHCSSADFFSEGQTLSSSNSGNTFRPAFNQKHLFQTPFLNEFSQSGRRKRSSDASALTCRRMLEEAAPPNSLLLTNRFHGDASLFSQSVRMEV